MTRFWRSQNPNPKRSTIWRSPAARRGFRFRLCPPPVETASEPHVSGRCSEVIRDNGTADPPYFTGVLGVCVPLFREHSLLFASNRRHTQFWAPRHAYRGLIRYMCLSLTLSLIGILTEQRNTRLSPRIKSIEHPTERMTSQRVCEKLWVPLGRSSDRSWKPCPWDQGAAQTEIEGFALQTWGRASGSDGDRGGYVVWLIIIGCIMRFAQNSQESRSAPPASLQPTREGPKA